MSATQDDLKHDDDFLWRQLLSARLEPYRAWLLDMGYDGPADVRMDTETGTLQGLATRHGVLFCIDERHERLQEIKELIPYMTNKEMAEVFYLVDHINGFLYATAKKLHEREEAAMIRRKEDMAEIDRVVREFKPGPP